MAKTYNHCTHMDLTRDEDEPVPSLLADINEHMNEMSAEGWTLVSTTQDANDLLLFWSKPV